MNNVSLTDERHRVLLSFCGDCAMTNEAYGVKCVDHTPAEEQEARTMKIKQVVEAALARMDGSSA